MRLVSAQLALLALLAYASAASIVLKIQPSIALPNPNALPPSTHATITTSTGAVLRSSLRKDNSIVFSEIPSIGSHLLNIYTKDYVFASYRIDTTPNLSTTDSTHEDGSSAVLISFAAQLFPGTQWSDTGLSLIPQQQDASSTGMSTRPQALLTIHPKVLSAKSFYEARQGFSPLSLLKNPMILLAGVALAFTFGMPKLMENMDPEMKAEYEEMQKKGPTAAIGRAMGGAAGAPGAVGEGFDLAGYLAGQKKDSNGADGIRGKK